MTQDYSVDITADSFSGIIFALEGMHHGVTLLNGPTGCKFYHAATVDNQTMKQSEFDPLNYPPVWYFGQPLVPCTYLDSRDYVYGSKEKLEEGLAYLRDNAQAEFIGIVNSPGASLIGDDLEGIAQGVLGNSVPFITVQTPGFSENLCAGFDRTVSQFIGRFGPARRIRPAARRRPSVNLLGICVFQKYHEGDVAEIARLLSLCGIDTNPTLGDGAGIGDLEAISGADLDVVVHPEYGLGTARFLEERFGIPYIVCEDGPIGFSATEALIGSICDALGCSPDAFRAESERSRARSYIAISRMNSLTGYPKGTLFSAEGTWSELAGWTSHLVRYFGMVPDALSVLCADTDASEEHCRKTLSSLSCEDALGRDILDTQAELVFGCGNTIAKLKMSGLEFSGIETALPSMGYVDVVPKTQLGLAGGLLVTEQVINGLMYR